MQRVAGQQQKTFSECGVLCSRSLSSANACRLLESVLMYAAVEALMKENWSDRLVENIYVRCHQIGQLAIRIAKHHAHFTVRAAAGLQAGLAVAAANGVSRSAAEAELIELRFELQNLMEIEVQSNTRHVETLAAGEDSWKSIITLFSRHDQVAWLDNKAAVLQRKWADHVANRAARQMLYGIAAQRIQKVGRSRLAVFAADRQRAQRLKCAVASVPVQSVWRGVLQRRREAERVAFIALQLEKMILIQAYVRGWLARRLYRILQHNERIEGAVFLSRSIEQLSQITMVVQTLEEQLFDVPINSSKANSFQPKVEISLQAYEKKVNALKKRLEVIDHKLRMGNVSASTRERAINHHGMQSVVAGASSVVKQQGGLAAVKRFSQIAAQLGPAIDVVSDIKRSNSAKPSDRARSFWMGPKR